MNKLTELIIQELSKKVETYLPDIYEHGWMLPISEDLKDEVGKVFDLKEIIKLTRLVSYINIEKEKYAKDKNSYLAARIPGHDLDNLSMGLTANLDLFKKTKKLENLNDLARSSIIYRAFCASMVYIASDGKNIELLSKIPTTQLPTIFSKSKTNITEDIVNISDKYPEYVDNLDLVKIIQLTKNINLIKEQYPDIKCSIQIISNGDYNTISVEDNGPGLPLPPERIYEIFEDFSTRKEGGLGLKLVKSLTKNDGYIEVITTPPQNVNPENLTFCYNTKDKICRPLESRVNKGTKFIINT